MTTQKYSGGFEYICFRGAFKYLPMAYRKYPFGRRKLYGLKPGDYFPLANVEEKIHGTQRDIYVFARYAQYLCLFGISLGRCSSFIIS